MFSKNKKYYLLFALILFVAVILRFYDLGKVPVSLYWDETAILLDAKTVATNGMDMHGNSWFQAMFPSYGDYKLPIYIWLASVSVKLVGVSEFALRLPSALAGVGTVLLSGAIVHQLMHLFKRGTSLEKIPNQWGTLLGCLIMALTPWSIMFSRTGFEGHVAQFLTGLSILLLLHSKNRKWLLLLSVLFGSLATYTYFSVRFVWPVVFLVGFLLLELTDFKIKKIQKMIKPLLIKVGILLASLFLYMVTLQPMFNSPLYEASNQFRLSTTSVLNAYDYPVEANILREQAGNTLIDRIIFHRHWLMLRELAKNYADNLDLSYIFLTGDPNLRHGTGVHGLLLLPTLPLLIWGIYLLGKEKPSILIFLGIWWIVGLLPASVPEDTPHALRSLNALLPLVTLVSFGALDFAKTLDVKLKEKKNLVKFGQIAALIALPLLFLISSLTFTYHYFKIYPYQSAYDWQDGYKQLATTIMEAKDGVETVWVDPFEDRFYLWLLTYGDYDATTIQQLVKNNYKVTEVENIKFAPFDWGKTAGLGYKVIIVGQPLALEGRIANSPKQPDQIDEIIGNDGTKRFLVARYEN